MTDNKISKILDECIQITEAEREQAVEYNKLSIKEKWVRKNGFINCLEYRNWLAQQRGFINHVEYLNWLAQQRDFADNNEYQQYCRFEKGVGSGLSMAKSKNSAQYLGIFIAERLLPKIFQEPKMMPYGNKGYDAICKNGHKIDVKSSLLGNTNCWIFGINYNKTADFFLCIGFSGSRDDLVVKYIWLFSGNKVIRKCPVNELKNLVIMNTYFSLSKVAQYELTNKVDDANDICVLFKKGDLK